MTILEAARKATVSYLPPGQDLVRFAIAKALTEDVPGEAHLYAAQRWGEKSRAARLTKANVPGLTTGAGAGDAMSDLAQARTEFFDTVRAASIIGRLPVRRVPFRTRTLSMDEPPRAGWRAEGAAYLNSPIKMSHVAGIERFDLGALIVVSKEVLQDESFDAEATIRDQLVRALAAQLDRDFIDPANSGTGGTKPASITSGAGSPNSPSEGIFDFGDAFTGYPNEAVIIMNPWQAARLSSAARPTIGARGGTWAGIPVITSTAFPEGQFALVDPNQIAVAMSDADVQVKRLAARRNVGRPQHDERPQCRRGKYDEHVPS